MALPLLEMDKAAGHSAYARGDFAAAGRHFSSALARCEEGASRCAAIAWANVGAAHQARGDLAEAVAAYEWSRRIWKQLGGDDDEAAVLLGNLAAVKRMQGDYREAERLHDESLGMLERLHGPGDFRLAAGWIGLGMVHMVMGGHREAEGWFRRALDARGLPDGIRSTGLRALGELLSVTNRPRAAVPVLTAAVVLRERLYGPDHAQTAAARSSLGYARLALRDYRLAERHLRRALPALAGSERAAALHNLGQARRLQGRRKEAEVHIRQAISAWESMAGAEQPNIASALVNLAALQADKGDAAGAEASLRRALEIDRRRLGASHPHVARDLAGLAAVCKQSRRYGEAENLYREALAAHEASGAAVTLRQAEWLEAQADLLRRMERNAEAARQEAKAMGIRFRQALGGVR